jgi:hypothetical protein
MDYVEQHTIRTAARAAHDALCTSSCKGHDVTFKGTTHHVVIEPAPAVHPLLEACIRDAQALAKS